MSSGKGWRVIGTGLIVVGSVVFLVGAALGVPSVFVTADTAERARLLTAATTRWRVAQFPYALGPVLAAVGVTLVGVAPNGTRRGSATVAGILLLLGSISWAYSCWRRGADPVAFARGRQPAWPFAVYVIATLVGLAVVGFTLVDGLGPPWLGWTVVASDAMFVALYTATGDIPPFVFYLLMLVVGLAL